MPSRIGFHKLKRQWNALEKLPVFPRKWRFSLKFIFPILFALGLLMWIPAHYQRVSAERVFDGIAIPDADRDIGLCFNFSANPASNDYFIKIPYEIQNDGYYPIEDVTIDISIFLEFTTKSGADEDKTIFSKEKTIEKINPGKQIEDYFEYDFTNKGWDTENIYYLIQNADPSEEVKAYMDMTITFTLEGHSGYTIIYDDIDLTDDTDTEVPKESTSTDTPDTVKNEITCASLIIMMAYMSMVMAILHFRRKSVNHQGSQASHGRNVRSKIHFLSKFNVREFLAKPRTKLVLRQLTFLSLFTIIPMYLYMNSLYQQKSSVISEVSTGDYMQRYEFATWLSVIFLCVIYLMTLLPSLKPKTFKPYSVVRGINSLGISIFGLISLLLWANFTSIIAYRIENSATVIIDSTPSFTPYVLLAVIYVAIKLIDVAVLAGYKNSFKTLRSERKFEAKKRYKERVKTESKKSKNEGELRELVFTAIKELGVKASITQIKKYVKRMGKVPVTRNGIPLDLTYLESLINRLYLSKKHNNIFVLEPEAEQFLETRQQQRESQKQQEEEKEMKHQTQELLDNAPELTFCPHCEQYQIFENGRCPMCAQ